MPAITLGDTQYAVLRQLLSCRCFSKAGLTINDSVAQTATITLGGVKHTDDKITATLGGVAYEYTTLVGDADLNAVATALAAVIDAAAAYTAAAVGSVITVTAAVAATAFTGSVAVSGAGATTTAAYAVTHVSTQSVETDNAIWGVINGYSAYKAATADITLSGGGVIPISSYRWYLVSMNTAGTMSTTPGVNGTAALPDLPENTCPIGCFKVVTDATHTFTPGVTPLNGTGITTTFYDLSTIPAAGVPA